MSYDGPDDGVRAEIDREEARSGVLLPAIPDQAKYSNAPTVALQELAWTARALVNAVTVPDAIRGRPGDILAVMLAGRELGIGPMAATRMVHIINGQTSIATELKLAKAREAGCDIQPLTEGEGWCVAHCTKHPAAEPVAWKIGRDTPVTLADMVAPRTWTIAGDIKQGGKLLIEKDNWRNYTRDMLWNRAASQFMRRHNPGLAGGLVTVEELGEKVDGEA